MSFFTKTKTTTDRYGNTETYTVTRTWRVIICAAAALLLCFTAISSFTIIPSGYTGVKTVFGQVDPRPVQPGFSMKIPFVQHVAKVNNKQQEQLFAASSKHHESCVWGESSERTAVYMEDVTVTYRINPEYSSWLYANVADYKRNALPEKLVGSALKSASVELTSAEVTNRAKIEPLAKEKLQSALDESYGGNQVITVVYVSIAQMDFEDSYNEAIAAKQVARIEYEQKQILNQQAVETANAEAEKTKIQAAAEAEKTKISAEAEADRKLIAANAAAEEQRIKAAAEADAIKAVADAQADANKKLAGSVSEMLIDYEKIQKWNGSLPTVSGADTSIVSIGVLE